MDTHSIEFYNPVALALQGARLQDFINEVLAKYNGLTLDGFRWNDDLLPDFTYEQVQRELKIDVMASYVDLNSRPIPISVDGDTIATGKIPRMKGVEYYDEAKLRRLRQMEDRRSVPMEVVINKAGIGLAEIFLKLVSRHSNSLTYQRHQIVSAGKFVLTDTNNPMGIKNVTFANHVPAANTTTLTNNDKWWTDTNRTTEGSSADPVKDLQKMVKTAKNKGVTNGHFEMNDDYLDALLDHSKVIEKLASKIYPGTGSEGFAKANIGLLNKEAKKAILEDILGRKIIGWDSKVSVEKWNNTTKKIERPTFDAFESNVVVYVPDGNIGEVLTVEPILLDGGEYASYYGGKLVVTVDKDYVAKQMSYNSEMTSLVVPDKPQYMWYLKPNND